MDNVEEFLEELAKDASKIDRGGIVRCTKLYQADRKLSGVRGVSVFATYTVEGQIVLLSHYCGETGGLNKEHDAAVIERANLGIAKVGAACGELGLDLRAGYLKGVGNHEP